MMIDWSALATQITQLAQTALPGHLLSVTLPLHRWPDFALPENTDWCFWQRPNQGLRLLGIGKACVTNSAGTGRFAALHAAQRGLMESWQHAGAKAAPPPLAFTGFAYAPQGNDPLPNASLWVPELLWREQEGKRWITFSCAADQARDAPAHWRTLWQALQAAQFPVSPAPTFEVLQNPLADAAFLARGQAAVRAIASGVADKLVLTRSVHLKGTAPIAAGDLLDTLAAQHPNCAIFGVRHAKQCFIGASPETLLALEGAQVAVDALAGTAWQASALALDADKNRREHDFVAHAVARALTELCHDITVPDTPEVMHLNTLTHLRRRVTARRPADVTIFDLLARLHPTPAVGGAPTAAALNWLTQHGDRRDAWYTGGIGWIDRVGNSDIAVALRCGLFDGTTATLYAGAGFVAGSDPTQELAETEAKFTALRAALTACTQSQQRPLAA